MLDTELVSRAFVRFSGPKLLGVLHKAENDIYERLGEVTLEDDLQRALELAEDVDHLVMAINLHLGFAAGRAGASLRGASADSTNPIPSCSFTPLTVSELMSILASLYSVLLDVTIGFSRSEADCANKLRVLVQRILTTFSPSYNIPRFSSESPAKPAMCADIRLLDVIAQAERITSLRNATPLLPLFDFALLSVKRLFSYSQPSGKKNQPIQEQPEIDSNSSDTAAVMLKAIVVVRIAKRIFSRHALRHLRALHTSNGMAFPHVGVPLLTAIINCPYSSELPESAHAGVDELRSFLLDYTSCTDELMERILLYLTRSPPSNFQLEEESFHNSSAENDCLDKTSPVSEPVKDEEPELPEKRRRVSSRGATAMNDTALFAISGLRNSEMVQSVNSDTSGEDDVLAIGDEADAIEREEEIDVMVKDDDDDNGEDDDGDDNIPLDQLRQRRPKSVDSTLSASWASCSLEQGSDHGLAESSTAASPSSNSTTNGGAGSHSTIATDIDSSSGGNVRRSARLSSKNHSKTSGAGSTQ